MIAGANINDPAALAQIPEEPLENELSRDLTSPNLGAHIPLDPLQLSIIERLYQRTVTEIRLPNEDPSVQFLLMNKYLIVTYEYIYEYPYTV